MHQHLELQHGILRQDVENDTGMFCTRILILMITNVLSQLKGFHPEHRNNQIRIQ